jgi:5-oxoprolinase (ATP-hydrolysing)
VSAVGQRWQFWIDRGGTFTDCLGRDPASGEILVTKVLSSDRAPLVAICRLLGLPDGAPIAPCDIRMGTTVATNALLERKGTPSALVITRGFGDLLEIGTGARPRIFEVAIEKPSVLYQAVLEVDARSDAEGRVLARPDAERVLGELTALRRRGLDSVAVVLMHAYRSSELELELGELARRAGFSHVALSHQVAAEIGLVGRGDTTCLDAYLTPLLGDYVRSLLAELPGSSLRIMQSSGGLTEASRFRGPNAILSGPAGGVVALAHVAQQAGLERVIGFDMGGTSTDVSRYDGRFERVYEAQVAGVRVRAPMMSIHTVAAGGGSLCRYDGRRLSVGPDSAGADPGPLAYGDARTSEPSLTDVNLVLGRFATDRFPIPVDRERPRAALERLAAELARQGDARSPEQVAEGFFQIANNSMAEAIRRVSVSRGYDVRDYALVVFGGAGGQHACALARRLGMRTIVSHPYASVLSAYGMGLADVAWHGDADAGREPLGPRSVSALKQLFSTLEVSGRRAIEEQGFSPEQIDCARSVDLRYRGTETALTLDAASAPELETEFTARHERRFGYARPGHAIEVVQARVEVTGRHVHEPKTTWRSARPRAGASSGRLWFDGRWLENVPRLWREELEPGTRVSGPALVLEFGSTIVVEPDFDVEAHENGLLLLRRRSEAPAAIAPGSIERPDPVLLEIMGNLYMSIAEQMGEVLLRTALSTNIRERLDFSCAVFDADAGLVANAPHIPVHLGAMGESVRAVAEAHSGDLAPGDVFVTNDPSNGGSHLPDVTVVTPVHDAGGRLVFFTASRGHHADVGGITPGSMPPFSHSLDEEGVVLSGLRIVREGRLDRDAVLGALAAGPYPARNPRENLADLEAQIAANRAGAALLAELWARYGLETVSAYMRHVQDAAAAKVAEEIARLADGAYVFEDALDDGTPIRVALRVDGASMCVDFTGTGPELPGNLNAPRAVTIAAVIYFLRTLVGSPIPLNSGCLRPVQIVIPERSVLSPSPGRAVAGGNVETSQRVVDVLFGAAGRAAASQGTMNNLTFGDARFGYYETIAGGAGAGPGFRGASAVQTHMTNTRITDAEVLEARYPIRLLEFRIQRGSGGAGRFPGGDGVVRELEFLAPMRVSILSERRTRAPFGLAGGAPGARGRNLLNGEDMGGKASREVRAGDRLRIETPGGGGYGPASPAGS